MTRSNSTLLIVLLMIFTFPIWIGIFGGIVGLAAGLIGTCIGIIGGVIGAVFGGIGAVFGGIGAIFNFEWFSFPFIHASGFRFVLIVALVFFIVLLSRSKRAKQ